MTRLCRRTDFGDRFFIVGGAGFIGSHFTDHLLADAGVGAVTLYDNFTSGREWHVKSHLSDRRLRVVRGDVGDLDLLTKAMAVQLLLSFLAFGIAESPKRAIIPLLPPKRTALESLAAVRSKTRCSAAVAP